MRLFEFIAPCHFGLEAVTKREITDLGYEILKVSDGKVTFAAGAEGAARANVFLRTPERILLKTGEFEALSFDELFEKTKALPWEDFIPSDGRVWVTKANSVSSALFSPSDIQSVMKKAIAERLGKVYHKDWLPETGGSYPLRVAIVKNIVTIGLDTTGESLHKRGYRKATVKAPITETLAAALIMLTPWKKDRILVDPFCGSGTFAIEAAMMAAGIAPGMSRHFTAEKWENLIDKKAFEDAFAEAAALVDRGVRCDIQGYDADAESIAAAMKNAHDAGVEDLIHLQRRDAADLSHSGSYGFIITNPPYGERLEEKKALPAIYKTLGERFSALDRWSLYVISAYEDTEKYIGRKADKNRKIYNGMMKTYFYQFMGPKPPKRRTDETCIRDR